MKTFSSYKTFILLFIILAFSALACQTLGFGLPTATSALDPIPTKTSTAVPTPTSRTLLDPTSEADTDTETVPPTPVVQAEPTPTVTPISLEMQKRIFQDLWEIVRDDYLYADFNGVDWDATYQEYLQKIEEGLETEEFYITMDEMIYSLGDEHSIFMSPQIVATEEQEYASGHDYVGIGIWVQFVPDKDHAVILLVFPGGPAEAAGIKMHDVILSVEGQPLTDESGSAIELLLGVEGTPVTFTIQTPGAEPRQMTVNRGRITGTLPVPYEVLSTPGGQRIGYIVLPTFSDSSIADQVGDALAAMTADAPLDGIILDNRINGGGYDNIMSSTLSYFVDGLVGHFSNRSGDQALRVPRRNVGGSADLPLMVLVGPDTVSFAEIFSGILKDQGRATLIGETTDGNVEILWGYNFEDGSRVWLAHDTFKPINDPDADWEHDGIAVDIEAPAYWGEFTTETDPAIQAALDFFDQ
jgi:C-terminal peptidase prc